MAYVGKLPLERPQRLQVMEFVAGIQRQHDQLVAQYKADVTLDTGELELYLGRVRLKEIRLYSKSAANFNVA